MRTDKNGRVVIGLSFGYHDSSCCIIKDGVLLAAVQEERFSRVKNDKAFPRTSLRYCLDTAAVALEAVDCVAYYEDPEKKLARQIWMGGVENADDARRNAVVRNVCAQLPQEQIREATGYCGPIEIVEHHLSHGASSYFFSGFDEAAVLTVDGVGEWTTTSYGRANKEQLHLFEEVHFPDSLGLLYSTVTSYLGFKVNSGEYKVMGLAPYGEPRYVAQLRKLITLQERGQYRLNLEYFEFLHTDRMYSQALIELMGVLPRVPESEIRQEHMDIAKSLQVLLEETLLAKVEYLYSQVPCDNLCMAGGVALNCVANGKILRSGPYENLFVQPAAGDAGTALGAAAVAYIRTFGERPCREPLQAVYLGPQYSCDEIRRLLARSSMVFEDFSQREPELVQFAAERLAEGKIVGWFQGRMEFGPRALGARSILADPRDGEMRERINALVKKREAFRPFAPAVLADKSREHFALPCDSPFMLQTCDVISLLDLPAITHVDNSARVQTVDERDNPRFHALLTAFERLTDCPILLNTSFNVRGEPIICSPLDAIVCFVRARIDYLVLGDFILDQRQVPEFWKIGVANTPVTPARRANDPRAIGHAVYTFL
jgi:carbamoyltransferase